MDPKRTQNGLKSIFLRPTLDVSGAQEQGSKVLVAPPSTKRLILGSHLQKGLSKISMALP